MSQTRTKVVERSRDLLEYSQQHSRCQHGPELCFDGYYGSFAYSRCAAHGYAGAQRMILSRLEFQRARSAGPGGAATIEDHVTDCAIQ